MYLCCNNEWIHLTLFQSDSDVKARVNRMIYFWICIYRDCLLMEPTDKPLWRSLKEYNVYEIAFIRFIFQRFDFSPLPAFKGCILEYLRGLRLFKDPGDFRLNGIISQCLNKLGCGISNCMVLSRRYPRLVQPLWYCHGVHNSAASNRIISYIDCSASCIA